MDKYHSAETYRVWAHDNQVYGPIEFATLTEWVHENRVLPDTWVFLDSLNEWLPARKIEPLQHQFPAHDTAIMLHPDHTGSDLIAPEELRQFAVLSSLSNQELAKLIRFGELREVAAGVPIIKRGEPGDAMYFVLAGTVRARLIVGLEDRTLNRIPAGEFFGEMAMFTQSARCADVVAEDETRLLRFSAEAFRQLISENADAAAPMLFAIARIMAKRIGEDNSRFQKEVAAEFVWR
jgi:hypothetical protein